MKTHREFRRNHAHVVELQHEVPVPGLTIVLAVCDDLEPEFFLQVHHIADCRVLDAFELDVRDLFLLRFHPALDQGGGSDQATDVLGTEGRLGALHGCGSGIAAPVISLAKR